MDPPGQGTFNLLFPDKWPKNARLCKGHGYSDEYLDKLEITHTKSQETLKKERAAASAVKKAEKKRIREEKAAAKKAAKKAKAAASGCESE